MLGFGLFKQQKPREFNFKPRFYDERKERLAKLRARYEAPTGEETFDSKLYREHLRDSWSQRRLTGNNGNSSMIRVMLIATVIAGLIYWIFN